MRMINRFHRVVAVLASISLLQGCGVAYSAKPITGRVVDSATKQPLAGVNVVAHWVVQGFGLEGGNGTDMVLMEAVTDGDGRYFFSGWGPKAVPMNADLGARLTFMAPELIFFKPDYWSMSVSNESTGPQPGTGPLTRTSDWDGKTVELKKFEGTPSQYSTITRSALSSVSLAGCDWKKIPRIIVVLDRESIRLEKSGIYTSTPLIELIRGSSEGQHCGSIDEFFKDYQ